MSRLLSLCLGLLALLSACGPLYETQYRMIPPTSSEGRLCVSQCQQTRSMCRQSCSMEQQACRNEARTRALYDYQAYVERQHREKKPVNKSVSDFEHSYGCGTNSCESRCEANYRDCFGGQCGGRVIAERVCTAFCDQAPRGAAPVLSPVPPGGARAMTTPRSAPVDLDDEEEDDEEDDEDE